MCRITGFLDFNYKYQYDILRVIIDMRDTLIHGGPDYGGIYTEQDCGLALGHRRLSILDLSSSGHQPMEFDNLVIVYNGEVYNFGEIKEELIKDGYEFVSNTDTEVVLKSFHRWGFDAVHKFRGMFAFAIWDKAKKKLILCRDRIGVKPLYWYYKDGLFMFASELKAFHKHPYFKKSLSINGLSLYLQYGYISSPYSIFENTYKLEPGSYLTIDLRGNINIFYYWKVEEFFKYGIENKSNFLKRNENEIIDELKNILIESFKLRLISDVPVGVFLSGGLDSSTVCALLAKEGISLKTFTIGFYEKEYNEAGYAKKIAEYLGTDHTELYCSPKEAFDIIPKLPYLYDEPFGDPSAIPTYLVSSLAKQKVKVALSADGGDEQFCGYTKYWLIKDKIELIDKFKPIFSLLFSFLNPNIANFLYQVLKPFFPRYNNFKEKYIKLMEVAETKNIVEKYDTALKIFLPSDLYSININTSMNHKHLTLINNYKMDMMSLFMLLDLKTYLPDDILVKVDRATMRVALEGREPFLDHKILEYTSMLPVGLKYKANQSKYILRKIIYKYIPKELIDRPKQGFSVPIYEWFLNDLKDLYLEYLNENRLKSAGIFDYRMISTLLKAYLEVKDVNYNKLWLLFVFELWRDKWMKV